LYSYCTAVRTSFPRRTDCNIFPKTMQQQCGKPIMLYYQKERRNEAGLSRLVHVRRDGRICVEMPCCVDGGFLTRYGCESPWTSLLYRAHCGIHPVIREYEELLCYLTWMKYGSTPYCTICFKLAGTLGTPSTVESPCAWYTQGRPARPYSVRIVSPIPDPPWLGVLWQPHSSGISARS
jgi:hypothetical protein